MQRQTTTTRLGTETPHKEPRNPQSVVSYDYRFAPHRSVPSGDVLGLHSESRTRTHGGKRQRLEYRNATAVHKQHRTRRRGRAHTDAFADRFARQRTPIHMRDEASSAAGRRVCTRAATRREHVIVLTREHVIVLTREHVLVLTRERVIVRVELRSGLPIAAALCRLRRVVVHHYDSLSAAGGGRRIGVVLCVRPRSERSAKGHYVQHLRRNTRTHTYEYTHTYAHTQTTEEREHKIVWKKRTVSKE